jgi:hypothetical protein
MFKTPIQEQEKPRKKKLNNIFILPKQQQKQESTFNMFKTRIHEQEKPSERSQVRSSSRLNNNGVVGNRI